MQNTKVNAASRSKNELAGFSCIISGSLIIPFFRKPLKHPFVMCVASIEYTGQSMSHSTTAFLVEG